MLRALLLEDSPRDVEILRGLLIDAGFDLDMDCTALEKEFISLLRSRTYDIILADFKLAGFDGFVALRWSMEICPKVPFICVSGTIGEETAVELLKQGAVDYVLKDRLARIPSAIHRALGEVKEKEARREAEATLRESEEKFRGLFESSRDAIMIMEPPSWKFTSGNPATVKMFGAKNEEEFVSYGSWELSPDRQVDGRASAEKSKEMIEAAMRDGTRFFEWTHRRIGGEEFSADVLLTRMEQKGKMILQATVRDITERKRAEEALRDSEELYRSLFENSIMGISTATTDGRLIRTNMAYAQMYGYNNPGAMMAEVANVGQLYANPDDRKELLQTLAEKGVMEPKEIEVVRRDGTRISVLVSAQEIRDASGMLLYHQANHIDITERKRAEEALSQSEERFKLLHEYAPFGIILSNRSGQILEVNPAALQILGSPSVEETKKSNLLTFPLLIKSGISAALKSCIETGQASFGEYSYTSKWEKNVNMHLRYVPILDDHNQVTLVQTIMEDITERKRADEAVRESEERFRTVFENAFDGISIYSEDPDPSKRRLVECNERYAAMAGRTREELLQLGSTLELQVTLDDTANDNRLKAFTDRASYRGSFSWIRPDRKENIIEYAGVAIIWRGKLHSIGIDRDITERERAEKQIRLLAHTIKSIAECVSITDLDDTILFVNDAFLTTYGYAEREILGKNINIVRSPNNAPDLVGAVRDAARNEGWHGEMLNRAKDGREFPISLSTTVVRDDNGRAVALVGVASDITERKQAENALAYERNLLNALMDNTPDHIYFKDKESRFLKISMAQAHYFGLDDSGQAVGKTDFDFFAEEHARPAFEDEQNILKSGIAIVGLEEKEFWPDGREGWVSTTKVPLRDVQGEIVGTFGISRDITKSKQAEEERQRLMTAFEQTLEAILVTDPVGIIQYVNPAFEQITGFTRKEAIGQNPRILNSGHQNAGFYEELWKTISTGGKWKGRFINKKKDGILFTDETSISPVLNEKGEITNYVGVKRDITSELSLQTQLTQAQKLEGIGTLASGIAHDFNNILGIIMGHTSLLDRVREDPNMYAESVAAIMKATQRGASLVKQIMLFARKTEPLLESVKVNVIIGEITKLLQETLPKTITISISLQQDLPAIVADSSQVHQVLLNLILNARDAMEKGGTLSISTRTIEGETVRSRFPKATARQYIVVEVADTGIGMDESTRHRIFEPFFTTKGVGKGTGLGLAVVFGIVEYHHGFIDVQSARGEGTSFAVYFPIPVHTGEEIHASGKKLEDLPGGTETILIIEDEAVLMKLAKNILVSKGYAVLTAEDGMQGVELYRSHQKEIAVVLSDIGLPVFGGHDVFRKIRAINPEAKIIFASGFFDPETKSEMYKAGLKNFIQKPYMQNEVLQKIRETIDSTTTIKNGGF